MTAFELDRALALAASSDDHAQAGAEVRRLLALGAQPNADIDGCTALHRAAAWLHGEALAALLEAGGDLDLPARDRVKVGPDLFVARRATARALLDETLRAHVKSGDIAYDDLRAQWELIAAAQGLSFDALIEGAKKKPAKPKKAAKGTSAVGTWTAKTFCYESSPDGDPDYRPRDERCEPDTWDITLAADGRFRSQGPHGREGEGPYATESTSAGEVISFDGLTGRWARASDVLVVVTTDDEHGSDVTWTFARV